VCAGNQEVMSSGVYNRLDIALSSLDAGSACQKSPPNFTSVTTLPGQSSIGSHGHPPRPNLVTGGPLRFAASVRLASRRAASAESQSLR